MAELRNLLRALAVDHDEPPSAVISRLEHTAAALQLEVMATCLVGRLEPQPGERWRLTWSSAGHLPPLLLREQRAQLLEPPVDLMFGVDRDTPRGDHVVDLGPGDVVLLYTDGLIEHPGKPLSHQLELLREAVECRHANLPEELLDELLAEFVADAADDVALFALAVAGS
jgi:serine phosphatase RsbU (regulator of sigma subunit)